MTAAEDVADRLQEIVQLLLCKYVIPSTDLGPDEKACVTTMVEVHAEPEVLVDYFIKNNVPLVYHTFIKKYHIKKGLAILVEELMDKWLQADWSRQGINDNPLIDFHGGSGRTSSSICPDGYTFWEIMNWDNKKWEATHDFIQWVFPTRRGSQFVLDAPVLNDEVIKIFRRKDMRERILTAFTRMKGFLRDGPNLNGDNEWWIASHNMLRITRVLECLKELGFHDEVAEFLAELEKKYEKYPVELVLSIEYWREAAGKGQICG